MFKSKNFKISSVAFIIPTLWLVFSFSMVKAAEIKTVSENTCNIEKSFNDFLEIRDNNKLEKEQKDKEVFTARKNLLENIISCSIKEINDTKTDLSNLKNLDEKNSSIKDYLNNKFDYLLSSLKDKDAEFQISLEDEDKIKTIAEDLLNWRENEYSDNLKNATNFSLTFKEDEIIKIAEARWQKISSSIKSLLSLKNKEITSLLQESSDKIKAAKDLNKKAYDDLISLIEKQRKEEDKINEIPPLEEAIITSSEKEIPMLQTETSSTASSTPAVTTTPGDNIKESLNKIKDVYQNFFKISSLVKKILGF